MLCATAALHFLTEMGLMIMNVLQNVGGGLLASERSDTNDSLDVMQSTIKIQSSLKKEKQTVFISAR